MKILQVCAVGFTIKYPLRSQIDYFSNSGLLVEIACSPGKEGTELQQQGYVIHPLKIERRISIFQHCYCLEKGQSSEDFRADFQATKQIFDRNNQRLESLIFPRNQFNNSYLDECKNFRIKAYRGNEFTWFYSPTSKANESWLRRGVRLSDACINISGHNCYSTDVITKSLPFNIPSSHFLRPYSSRLQSLEMLRLRRILLAMTYAAKQGLVYHLWWHPHNFGIYRKENLLFLQKILEHYSYLQTTYSMESLNMGELANKLV